MQVFLTNPGSLQSLFWKRRMHTIIFYYQNNSAYFFENLKLSLLLFRMGTMIVEMYWKHAPSTCRNFMELIRRGYYNNTKFHRIIRDFMIQGGDPTGTGKGGQSIYGSHFDDEITSELKHTGAGIISMANAGPDTNSSQFFITLAPTQWLDGKHTIFGRVQSGISVVKRIGLVECDVNDCPVDDIRIERAYIPK